MKPSAAGAALQADLLREVPVDGEKHSTMEVSSPTVTSGITLFPGSPDASPDRLHVVPRGQGRARDLRAVPRRALNIVATRRGTPQTSSRSLSIEQVAEALRSMMRKEALKVVVRP
jgi:hypothetical protein